MAPLSRLMAAVLLGAAAPAAAQGVDAWTDEIGEAARRFRLPPAWIARVMRIESGGHTHRRGRPIRSSAGAIGLMQLMPGTWAAMRARLGLGRNPDAPRDNILAGALYLRLMYDRFGYPGLFAAYNAGPGRYAASLSGASALPAETRAYLAAATCDAGSRGCGVPASRPPSRGMVLAGRDGVQSSAIRAEDPRRRIFFALGPRAAEAASR